MSKGASKSLTTDAKINRIASAADEIVIALHKRDRWLGIHSFSAYILFCVLIGGAFYYLYSSQVSQHLTNMKAERQARIHAEAELARSRAEMVKRAEASAQASKLWKLHKEQKFEAFAKAYDQLDNVAFTKTEAEVLSELNSQISNDVAREYYKKGLSAYRRKHYKEAAAALAQTDKYKPEDPLTLYYLGISQLESDEPESAAATLEKALNVGVEKAGPRSTYYYYGLALASAGELGKARQALNTFIARHPRNGLVKYAKQRLRSL